jgi:CRISPR/Cas system-associated exonuclease Cas4 (RecB family)
MEGPRLVESSFRTYLDSALQNSHNTRVTFYYYIFNIAVLILFLSVFGGALYYCSINKLTPVELTKKRKQDQEFILSKIRHYQAQSRMDASQTSRITNLPTNTNPDFREMFEL